MNPITAAAERAKSFERQAPSTFDRDAIQYVWFAGADLAHDDVGTIRRCRWQPITRVLRWESILCKENPEEYAMRRNTKNPNGKPTEGGYWIKPGSIVNSLREQYGEWGILVSDKAKGCPIEEFAKLDVDQFFFPQADEDLPKTHRECVAQVQARTQAIKEGELKGAPQTVVDWLLALGNEMLASLAATANHRNIVITDRLAEIEKAKYDNSGKFRGSLDARDRAMLAWMEITPPEEALKKAAVDQFSLADVAKQLLMQPQAPALDTQALGAEIGKSLAEGLAPLLADLRKPAPTTPQPAKR